jgi:signal transduction histidine kinase
MIAKPQIVNKMKIAQQRDEIHYWQLANTLEEGRNQVLRMVARNEDLQLILTTLCEKAQLYNPDMLCSILRLNNEQHTLHPIASVSLPQFYCDALEGVAIGAGAGSCGTAAFTGELVIVEDINTHPYWTQFKELALEAGVQACWSEPIIGADGLIYGTFAMYYREPTAPSSEDLKFIELSANLAAVVFENNANREKLLTANNLLSQTVDERNQELEKVNARLEQNLQQQQSSHFLNINTEKMLTTNSLISGFSHEISSPLGTALTVVTSAEDQLSRLDDDFMSAKLTRKIFIGHMRSLTEMVALNKQSLLRATDLLARFKEVNSSANTELVSTFAMPEFFTSLHRSVENILAQHQLYFNFADDLKVCCAKVTLWQVLVNLIENSVLHGFVDMDGGVIHINVIKKNHEIIINYQDNGCGISKANRSKIFEPFYSSNRVNKSIGLGLNIVSNFVTDILHGSIKLLSSPVGVRYEIRFVDAAIAAIAAK